MRAEPEAREGCEAAGAAGPERGASAAEDGWGMNEQGDEQMTTEDVAKVCHEANRALCETHGDESQTAWEDAPDWQKKSAINGVRFRLENPNAGPSASHENWLKEKRETGWTYGPVKDPEKKQHPCCVPYDELPLEQQAKDALFIAVVDALKGFLPKSGTGRSEEEEEYASEIIGNKGLRRDIDEVIQRTKVLPSSRERALAITKLQEAVMWLGMDLKRLGEINPYPNSRDTTNTVIDPTADGLKL